MFLLVSRGYLQSYLDSTTSSCYTVTVLVCCRLSSTCFRPVFVEFDTNGSRSYTRFPSCCVLGSMMAAQHVSVQPFRPVFLATAGTPPVEWRRWIDMFEDYILAVGFPVPPTGSAEAVITATAQRKAALFRSSLGTEGYRVYCSLTDNAREPYADAVTRLRGHFDQPASIIFSRAQFSRR